MNKVEIALPHSRYDVCIEPGILENLGENVRALAPAKQCALVTDKAVGTLYAERIEQTLTNAAYSVQRFEFDGGEAQKSLETVSDCYQLLLNSRLDRRSPVIGLGGGVVGDTAGFIAATYLRGVPFIQVPTSLLAMVDASVGGKVGVNVPQGKNLIGAFYQPRVVLIDPLVLQSLPTRELRCGLAECVKHGLLADEELFSWTSANLDSILRLESESLVELITRNVQVKADVVVEDEKEQGKRALLNLGHTFGHAIEKTSNYAIQHGEAVALGVLAATEVSCNLNRCSRDEQAKIEKLFERIGLPTRSTLPPAEELYEAMKLDKKVQDGSIRLVLLERIGEAFVLDGVAESEIIAGFERVREAA